MGAADFRVGGRIFATLASQKGGYGNLMLTPELQAEFVTEQPDVFLPVAGGWGKSGATHIRLSAADEDMLSGALRTAWRSRIEKNAKAVRDLEALAPYPGPVGTLTVDRIGAQRAWVIYYGGLTYRRHSFDYDSDAWKFSPQYTDRDLRLTDKGSLFSLNHLLGIVERTNFESVRELRCPIFIFQGKHDYETSWQVVNQWFARVHAPRKGFVTFEASAHMGMLEQPGEYLRELVNLVRPIAVEDGDGAPPGVSVS